MCGIGGLFSLDKDITAEQVDGAFKRIQYRGRDACGLAALVGKNWNVLKAQGQYVVSHNREFMLDHISSTPTNGVLLHVRAATHGEPSVHSNNHPIIGSQYLMIHNGVVNTPKQLPAVGQTDTEQMLRHIEMAETIADGLQDVGGWLAIALASIENPRNIYLYTNGMAPLYIWRSEDRDLLEFSSCQFMAAEKAPTNLLMRVNLRNLMYASKAAHTKPSQYHPYYDQQTMLRSLVKPGMNVVRPLSTSEAWPLATGELLSDGEAEACLLDQEVPRGGSIACDWPRCAHYCETNARCDE